MTENERAALSEQGEREAFEAWALAEKLAYRDQYGFWFYEAGAGHLYWKGWQARASLRASPAVPVAQDERIDALMNLVAEWFYAAQNDPAGVGKTNHLNWDSKEAIAVLEAAERLAALSAATPPAAGESVAVDRSDAVNLARNMLDHRNCKGITSYGVRVLCEAILKMDAALATPPAVSAEARDAEELRDACEYAQAINAIERDALRYRWLRNCAEFFTYEGPARQTPWAVIGINHTDCYPCSGNDLDAAIDAAMGTQPADKENGK